MKHQLKLTIIFVFISSMTSVMVHASMLSEEILSLPITTLTDRTINLGQYKGKKPVYLKFWATWCRPCRKQMPHFQHVQEKYGEKMQLIGINIGVNDNVDFIRGTKNEFGLTMPITIDVSGKLAQTFNLVGTPFHVLIDKSGNIVHKGHKASKALDKKIELLTSGKSTDLPNVSVSFSSGTQSGIKIGKNKYTALFFISTWCNWYLKESRPEVSGNCIDAQKSINAIYKQFPQYNWVGIATRLWTGEKELAEYKIKFDVVHSLKIDTSNKLFFDYHVKNFPALILLKDGEEILRVSKFNNQKQLKNKLRELVSNVY